MFLYLFYPFIKFTLGTLYPAYKTWKSLKRKDETIRRRWMKYWISFSVFQTVEYFADLSIAFFIPFYTEIKITALMWLVHMRASSLIDSAVDKELKKREKMIDCWLKKFNNEFFDVIWFELSRFSIKILAILLSYMTRSQHIAFDGNEPMETDEDCDTTNNIANNNNNELEYNISENMGDRTDTISARRMRYKRERISTVQFIGD